MFTFKKRSTGFFLLLCYDLLLIFFDIGLCHEYLNFFKALGFGQLSKTLLKLTCYERC